MTAGIHPPVAPEERADARQVIARRYEVLSLLGAGGMGTVYRVHDRELGEEVALKMVRRELLDTPGILERFRREARLARRVTHRNVARVFDVGEGEGERFLTMELVDGEPLSALLAREGALPLTRASEIASDIAAGLASAHAAGVVHRDLKPDNVILARDGRVVVTDFGIACAFLDRTVTSESIGVLIGTPAYMAPEQVEGRADIDHRADIYAMGALLYELFTGESAWFGGSAFAIASARLLRPPPDPRRLRPDLPGSYAELVLRAMARHPEDRPATMEQVAATLGNLTLPAPAPIEPRPITAIPGLPPGGKTTAVLPFRNGGAPDDDYLAEELTDDLIDALSMTSGIKVRPRGAVLRFRGIEVDARDVGKELGVEVVVEGSVRRARGQVKITARVVSVGDGFQLWAKRFDRPEQDVLTINDEVARAIAAALTVDARATRSGPSDPVAVDLYLRARHEYRGFWPEHLRRAIALFEQANVIAPDDPAILSGMAAALARAAFFSGGKDLERARDVAARAVAAAPDLGEAHLSLGLVHFHLGDYPASARSLRLAVRKTPGLAEAHVALGRLLVEIGAFQDGMPRLEAALALDAEAPAAHAELMRSHALLGNWEACDEVATRVKNLDAAFGYWTLRARFALWRGDRALAAAHLARLPEGTAAVMRVPLLVRAAVEQGKIREEEPPLEAIAMRDEGGIRRRAFLLQVHAEMAAHLEEDDRTLEALRLAAEVGLVDLAWLERCPLFRRVRMSPRYYGVHALVKKRAEDILEAYRTP